MDEMMRPVLLGMNNPISSRPEYALWPDPPRCTGWHIWKLLEARCGATQEEYIKAFDRRNLLPGKTWDGREARRAAAEMRPSLQGRTVVLLGQDVRAAFRVPPLLIHPQTDPDGVTWRQLPHPSGLNRWYNEEVNRVMAGMLLADLIRETMTCT